MANASAIDSKLHIPRTNYHLLAAQQESYRKEKRKEMKK